MDSRRTPRTVIDPKVRHVRFFAPPDRTMSGQSDPISYSSSPSPRAAEISPSGNSLSPVMIPPRRHSSDSSRPVPFVPHHPASPLRGESIPPGRSYNPSDFFTPSTSPTAAASFSDDVVSLSPGQAVRGSSVRASASSSFPGGGFDLTALRANSVPASELTTVSVVNTPPGIAEKAGASVEMQSNRSSNTMPAKEKTTKAERRALQEAQRSAKAAAKAEGSKLHGAGSSAVTLVNAKPAKGLKAVSQKHDNVSVAASEKKFSDRLSPYRKG